MSTDRILQEIIVFMDENNWLYPRDIVKRETRIEEDLLISGHDAVDFLVSFGRHFNVDVSNFMADEYFEPEGKMVFFDFQHKKNKKILTVGDLEKAVELGYLI